MTELGFSPEVRELELGCRKGWNNDLWQASTDDLVIEIRTKNPDAKPGSGTAPIAAAESVADADERDSRILDGNDCVISLSIATDR